jgi:hypothetical protein
MIRAFAALFVASALLTFGLITGVPGCSPTCYNTFDCASGSYCESGACQTDCFIDEDCRAQRKGFICAVGTGRCKGDFGFGSPNVPIAPEPDDGWQGFLDPVNTGRTFVINRLGIASDPEVGLDIDSVIESPKVDNVLSAAAGYANNLIEGGVVRGESLVLMEIAGLDEDFRGDDREVTVKIYGAIDADEPPRFANNFTTPPGESSCCRFNIDSESIPNNQAEARFRARISGRRIQAIEASNIAFTLAIGNPPHQKISFQRARIAGALIGNSVTGIREGLIGGAIPMADLGQNNASPFCLTGEDCSVSGLADRTVLDLVAVLVGPQPDIDLDGDGPECTLTTSGNATVDACCDGSIGGRCLTSSGNCQSGIIVPPVVPSRPSSCAEDPRIRDGYSVALSYDAVPATVIGVR